MPKPRGKLTPKQERFVEEYLKDLNGARAVKAAGYRVKSTRNAAVIAAQNLAKLNVQAAIQGGAAAQRKRTQIDADRVLLEWARLAFADQRAFVSWGPDGIEIKPSAELSDDDAAAVAEIVETRTKDGGSIKIKLHDKTRALEALSKHLKLYDEKGADNMTDLMTRVLEAREQVARHLELMARRQEIADAT